MLLPQRLGLPAYHILHLPSAINCAPAYKYSLFLYILVMTVEFSFPRLSDWHNADVQRVCSHSADCQDWQQTDSIRLRLSGVHISCSERKFSSEFRRFVTEFWKFSSEFSIRTANTELRMANTGLCMAIHILHLTSAITTLSVSCQSCHPLKCPQTPCTSALCQSDSLKRTFFYTSCKKPYIHTPLV